MTGLFDDLDDFDAPPLAPAVKPAGPFTSVPRTLVYRTAAERDRLDERAFERRQAQRRQAHAASLAYASDHPQAWAWMNAKAPTFDFAAAMLETVQKYGDLTPKQADAVARCINRDKERDAQRSERIARADAVRFDRIVEAFNTVKANGAKKAALRLQGLTLSMAPATGRNPGAIYAKRGETYLGKIDEAGTYRPSYASTPADLELLRKANVDPLAQAIVYARQTGECSCCGRELTDPESIRLGIGPICRDRWGF